MDTNKYYIRMMKPENTNHGKEERLMTKRNVFVLLACLIGLTLVGCATTLQSYKPKTPEEALIKDLLVRWETTWNSHDVEANLALWNEKAQIMYGRAREIATKEEYSKILPERMKAHPSIHLGTPKIRVSGNKANVSLLMSLGGYQLPITFHLVKESGNWTIMSWEY